MKWNIVRMLLSLFALLLISQMGISASTTFSASKTPQAILSFSNQTVAMHANMQHQTPLNLGPSSMMTGGAAAGDFNNDGWMDLFVVGGGLRADALFINAQDGTFDDRAASAELSELHVGSGATVGDYNNDGWLDIFVTSFGDPTAEAPGQHRLYRNNGDLTFTEVAASAGVNQTSPSVADGFGAAFGDYDLDGDLDLAVAGWRKSSLGNRLFRNNGDGTFGDVTTNAGITAEGAYGFSPCFTDMDGDRYPELLWVSDFGTSIYFVNLRDGTFIDNTIASGAGHEWSGMGTTTGDFNNDGHIDWYVTAIFDLAIGRGDGNKLYLNQGGHQFIERAALSGVAHGYWGWGTVAVDLNLDGWLDIVETNGWPESAYTGKLSRVWLNNGDNTFDEVAAATGFDHALDGRGLLSADFDNDGDQDIVVTSLNDELRLYRNDMQGTGTNWLRVLLDTSANPRVAPNGYGSRVVAKAGGKTYYRYLNGCSNYLTQGEVSAHFGLGSATLVDELRVEWADGSMAFLSNIAANQTITVASSAEAPIIAPNTFIPIIAR